MCFSNNGQNRCLILGITPGTKEDYDLLAEYLEGLGLERGTFHLCADLKVINIVLRLMPHSSRHPCYACVWPARAENDDWPVRTFEGIREDHERWKQSGGDANDLKNFNNCRSVPFDFFPLEGIVLFHVPPSSLHLMLGAVNHLWDGLSQRFPGCEQWASELNLTQSDYFGKSWEGRPCRTLLKNVPILDR
jgi:hypothetical protein